MPSQPFISIPLDIADVRILQTDLTKAGELILTVESTLEHTTCRKCGRIITEQHGSDKSRLLRHLPVLGRPVYLRIHPKRFRCPWCDDHPTTTQQLDWYDPQALHTKAYERHLIVQRVNSTVQDVVAKEDVSVVIDRFHVARHYRDGVDTLRKQELRRLKKELPKSQHDDLKRTLWPFRKRADDLVEGEQERLTTLLSHSPQLERAYTLREELTVIFDTARSKADGLRRMRFWRQRVERSGLTCFNGFLALLDRWLDLIANYFIAHHTSGFVEGLNNKLKVLKRRCYGMRNIGRLFQRLWLDLDGYRRFSPWQQARH